MDDPRYAEAKRIFLAVCDLPPDRRAEAVARACGDDAGLRADVESLLEHHDAPDLVGPDTPTLSLADADHEPAPRRIGPYRVIREIGRGGMGVVYLALREDDQFRRRVAIKLLKRGMDTEEILRRFKLEEQLLAAMNHPGIARLFNAGETEGGLPYFVMEHVEGLPIDDYCDVNRLHLDERLELFQKVCDAVHHAHQNLVVHRDLKPSNILVNQSGEPKLLDFGIAKVLHPEFSLMVGDPTAPELRIMTPEYASPEQVRGLPVTTASDVYSLGVVLYELVSGHAPYRLRSRLKDELVRVICDEDPERPSTAISRVEEPRHPSTADPITPESVGKAMATRPERLRKRLAGDVDNIVMMAMRKEPQRRYRSVEQLSEDIQRHLRGMPVIARPDTVGYRISKFVGRHRAGVAAAAVIAILLVGGVAGTSTGWRAAEAERVRTEAARQAEQTQREMAEAQHTLAETQRDRADGHVESLMALSRTFMFEVHDAVQQLDGALPARELLVETARTYIDGLAAEFEDDLHYRLDVANAYDRVGDIHGSIRNPSLGDVELAMENYEIAISIRRELAETHPDDPAVLDGLAASHENFGDVFKRRSDVTGALAQYREQLRIRERLADAAPDFERRRAVAVALQNVGGVLLDIGENEDGAEHYARSLAIRRRLAAERPDDTRAQRDLASALLRAGGRQDASGDHRAALASYREAERIRARLVEENPDSGRWRRDLGVVRYFIGGGHLMLHEPSEALGPLQYFLEVTEQRILANPRNARTRRDLAAAHEMIGQVHAALEQWDLAMDHYRRFREVVDPLSAEDPANTQLRGLAARSRLLMGEALRATDDLDGAEADLRAAVEMMTALSAEDPDNVRHGRELAGMLFALGRVLDEMERSADALITLDGARARYASAREREPDDRGLRAGYARTLRRLARIRFGLGEPAVALALTEEALRTIEGDTDPDVAELRTDLEADLERYR
jgi:serine/threonine protein kinase/tetratricopeptide (TPR) repeat protein